MSLQPVLIAGEWRAAKASGSFHAENPATGEPLPAEFPVSTWADCDAALNAAAEAAEKLRTVPPEQIAKFLTRFAERIEARKTELVEIAHAETALPKSPRLADVELPRTTNQLRQAAAAALEGSWALPTIDTKLNIRSHVRADRTGFDFRAEQFSVRLQRRGGRRFCGGDCGGQSRHRQGASVPSATRRNCWRKKPLPRCAKPVCRRPRCR